MPACPVHPDLRGWEVASVSRRRRPTSPGTPRIIPDPRWPPLLRDLRTAIEFQIADLRDLGALDAEQAAPWCPAVMAAVGCLEGARALLDHANAQREAYVATLKPEPGPSRH